MTIIKVSENKYINVDRMTCVTPGMKEGILVVHFDVGGGGYLGPSCTVTLEGEEVEVFKRWLNTQASLSQD
jgi:hypothetical protein